METLEEIIGAAGGQLWTWAVLPVVIGLGLYFTIRTGVVQFRLIPEMFRTLTNKTPTDAAGRAQSVSAFQAFTVSAASRVGVGNIAGVGTAIAVGGPGAIFWMWTMAFIGGATSFVESTLGQLYKTRDRDAFRGGPAYYIERGLGARWAGIVFAIVLIICFPFAFSSLQANTISATISSTMGAEDQTVAWVVGGILAVLTALVVFGGIRRIASVTQSVVPAMALLYLGVGIVIVAMNVGEIPRVFGEIFSGAFGFQEVAGGVIGTIILTGVQRGMFSNEAGLGSAPNAGASAAVTHPAKQGLVQTLGVYFDTFLVCSITAFIILVSNPDLGSLEEGISTTQDALVANLGSWASVLLSVIIFLLAFSSILGNYYYGEANIEFITTSTKVLTGYRALAVVAVLAGSVASTSLIWTFADGMMGVMALINLVAIALLSGIAFKLLRNYSEQRSRKLDPVFTQDQVPGLKNVEFWQDADTVTGPIRVPKVRSKGRR